MKQYLELGVEQREAGCPNSTSISEAEKINGSLVLSYDACLLCLLTLMLWLEKEEKRKEDKGKNKDKSLNK